MLFCGVNVQIGTAERLNHNSESETNNLCKDTKNPALIQKCQFRCQIQYIVL